MEGSLITNLLCVRTNIVHMRTKNGMPLCDPQGIRFDTYENVHMVATCMACHHVVDPLVRSKP